MKWKIFCIFSLPVTHSPGSSCSMQPKWAFQQITGTTISFLSNHWILMTPANVLSLANEVEWQSAGNKNLNTRVCLVMEIPYHMKHGYVWGLQFHSILISQVHANMCFALTLTCRLDSPLSVYLPADSYWRWTCEEKFLSNVQHAFLILFQALWERKCVLPSAGMCWSLQTGFRNSSETQLRCCVPLSLCWVLPNTTAQIISQRFTDCRPPLVTQRNKVVSVVPAVKGHRKILTNQHIIQVNHSNVKSRKLYGSAPLLLTSPHAASLIDFLCLPDKSMCLLSETLCSASHILSSHLEWMLQWEVSPWRQ